MAKSIERIDDSRLQVKQITAQVAGQSRKGHDGQQPPVLEGFECIGKRPEEWPKSGRNRPLARFRLARPGRRLKSLPGGDIGVP